MKTEFETTRAASAPGAPSARTKSPYAPYAHVTAPIPKVVASAANSQPTGCRGRRTSSVTPTTAEITAVVANTMPDPEAWRRSGWPAALSFASDTMTTISDATENVTVATAATRAATTRELTVVDATA